MGRKLKEIILDEETRNRISDRQHELSLSDSHMSHCCGDNINIYKNLKTKTKSIDKQTLDRIAHELKCSTDYLCHKTDVLNGKISKEIPLTTEIPFIDHTNQYLEDICASMRADNELLRALHLLLVDLPKDIRNPFVTFLKATTSSLNQYNLIAPMMNNTIDSDKLSALKGIIEIHNEGEFDTLSKYHTALEYYKKSQPKNALKDFLSVIIKYYELYPRLFLYAKASIEYIERIKSKIDDGSFDGFEDALNILSHLIDLLHSFKEQPDYWYSKAEKKKAQNRWNDSQISCMKRVIEYYNNL